MEVLQDLLTDPKPLEAYSLLGLPMNIQQTVSSREGHGISKRCMRSIPSFGECKNYTVSVQNVLIK